MYNICLYFVEYRQDNPNIPKSNKTQYKIKSSDVMYKRKIFCLVSVWLSLSDHNLRCPDEQRATVSFLPFLKNDKT